MGTSLLSEAKYQTFVSRKWAFENIVCKMKAIFRLQCVNDIKVDFGHSRGFSLSTTVCSDSWHKIVKRSYGFENMISVHNLLVALTDPHKNTKSV